MGRKTKHAQVRHDRPADLAAGNASSGSDAGKAIPGHSDVRVDPVSGDKRHRRPQWMTRLRSNSYNVEHDTSDSDGSFSHSKQIDDDTRDDDDDIEILLPRNVSNEIPRSSVFRRVNTEIVPAPPPVEEQRKVSGEKPRKVTFDNSPTSSKRTAVAAKGILKKPEPGPYAVVMPLTPTQVLNQEPVVSTPSAAENVSDQSSRGSPSRGLRLHLPRRPSRSSTLESVSDGAQVTEVAHAGKPRQVMVESPSPESHSPVGTSSLAKEIARELVKEVKLLQPEPMPPSPPTLSLDSEAHSSPNLVHAHRTSRLGVRRRQQAWRQRRVVRKAVSTDAYVDKVLEQVNSARASDPVAEPVSRSSSFAGSSTDAPSFYWDPLGAFEFYTSTAWWDNLRDRANVTSEGSRPYRKQLFLTVDGAIVWVYSTVTGCVSRLRSRCESVMGLVSRIQARFGWSSDGGAVPAQ
ncbi:hypothetical protein CJU89_1085 [Yarrowia sp. B02]|nr:hypothetical protein CJU89_1085 [Yarrowia sp. B02]